MSLSVFCFSNGNYAVCDGLGDQVPHVQGSWLLEIADRLGMAGYSPLDAIVTMPNGRKVMFFVISSGLNWRITSPDQSK